MTPITLLHSTKYDGSLHYRFGLEAILLRDDLLLAYSAPGQPMRSYRDSHTTTMHMLGVFPAGRYWNLHVAWHADWRPKMHYVNIATPTTWHDGAVRYVDMDLDVILGADESEVRLDDADEFERHGREWSYPPELVAKCLAAAEEVGGLFRSRSWPFDGSLYAWRPGQPVVSPSHQSR